MTLSLEAAEGLVVAAADKARELGLTVSIAVVDPGGYLIAFGRMEAGGWVHAEVAVAKARASAALNRSGTELLETQRINPHFAFQSQFLMKGRYFREKGSLPVHDSDGNLLGALAVSGGGTGGEEDEVIAKAAVQALEKGAIRVS